jgi:phosphatidate cytidylyltransferase
VTEKNKNLVIRIVSALVLLPIVLFLLYKGDLFSGVLFAVAAAACAHEYISITLKSVPGIGWLVIAISAFVPLLPVLLPYQATALVCAASGVVLFSAWVWHLLKGPLAEAPVRTAHLLTAFLYGSGGLVAIAALRQIPDGIWWVVALLVVTWGNDTSAYFAGRFLGKHKLYPEVSPNKTWEGFFGGMVGSTGMLFILRAFFFPSMTGVDCVLVGFLGGIFGPAGDLCESMLKRAYQVKDSGNIIPGHGGMLDRIDALIFNAPMVMLYVQFVRGFLSQAA